MFSKRGNCAVSPTPGATDTISALHRRRRSVVSELAFTSRYSKLGGSPVEFFELNPSHLVSFKPVKNHIREGVVERQ